jgi:type III secretion protein J
MNRGVVVLASVIALSATACTTNILHGIDERSANEATSALERAGIGAEKVLDEGAGAGAAGYTIRVARADGSRAVDLLRALGLPRDRRRGLAETYGQPSLIPTPSEERARYLDAIAGEVERTLESADGVVDARVHLVLEETDPLAPAGKPRTPARAAVLLKVRAGKAPLTESDVQKLVSGSVAGLESAAVAVVMAASPEASDAPAALSAVGPLRISPGTRPLLLVALAITGAILAALAILLLLTSRRLSALERQSSHRRNQTGTAVGDHL